MTAALVKIATAAFGVAGVGWVAGHAAHMLATVASALAA